MLELELHTGFLIIDTHPAGHVYHTGLMNRPAGVTFKGDTRQEKTHSLSGVLTFPCGGPRCAGSLSCGAPWTDSALPGIWSSAVSKPRAEEEKTDGGKNRGS